MKIEWWMYIPFVIFFGGLYWFFMWGIDKATKEASKNEKEKKQNDKNTYDN
jgi:hypothetical protein